MVTPGNFVPETSGCSHGAEGSLSVDQNNRGKRMQFLIGDFGSLGVVSNITRHELAAVRCQFDCEQGRTGLV